jgi:acylphosphatase
MGKPMGPRTPLADRGDVRFRGRVQGVGFRATVIDVATNCSATGYVSNTSGGEVHLVAEGSRRDVTSLIQGVLRRMSGLITDHAVTWSPGTGEFPDFRIHRDEP